MGLYIICQLNTEDMLDSLLAFLVFHREHDFYTFAPRFLGIQSALPI